MPFVLVLFLYIQVAVAQPGTITKECAGQFTGAAAKTACDLYWSRTPEERARLAKAQQDAQAQAQNGWSCSTSDDKMRGTRTRQCSVESKNVANFAFPYQRPNNRLSLIVRKGQTKDAIITIDAGQLTTDQGSLQLDEGYVAVKAGSGPVKTFRLLSSTSNRSDVGFIGNANAFIRSIEKGGPLIIEAHFYQYGRMQFEFDLQPLPQL